MKRGNNNVFKLSGNLALGGGNDYLANQVTGKVGSYGVDTNVNRKSNNYGQSYQNTNQYDYKQKSGTSEKRKYSQNQQQNGMNSYSSGLNYGNSYTKVDNNYQHTLNKLSAADMNNYGGSSYKEINGGGSSYKQIRKPQAPYKNSKDYQEQNNQYNAGSYKDTYNNSKPQLSRNSNNIEANRGYDNKGYDNKGYDNKGYNNKGYDNRGYEEQIQQVPKTITRNRNYQQPSEYQKPTLKPPINNYQNKKPTNVQTKQSAYYQQQDENNYRNQPQIKKHNDVQIKQYDPSTFVMCRQGCGRKFNPDSVSKHQKICKKVFQNKRKQFNTQQQRIVQKQQKKFMKQGQLIQKRLQQKKAVQSKKQNGPKWKAESLGLRAILKANRRGGQMTQQQKKLIDKAQQSSTVKCSFCGRTFSIKAAQRHVPFCQSQQKKSVIKKKK